MENENTCPVAQQVCEEEVNAIETEYTINPDGSVAEITGNQNQAALA